MPRLGVAVIVVMMFVIQMAVFVYRCFSFQQLKKKTFPTMVGLSAIATSALFTAVAGTMVFVNGNGVEAACAVSTWVCIALYMATKGQLYLFFIERMHIVHKKPSQTRMESPLYLFNMCLLIPFVALFFLMIYYRISFIGDDQRCRHGLRRESTIPGIIYDTMFSIYSVLVFVWPLFKSQSLSRSDGLRWVVKKNIIGSVVSTVSTFLNIFSYFNREVQDTDYCFLRCTADVMVNVLVMNYLINSSGNRKSHQDQSNCNNSTSYHRNKSSVASHREGHGESEEVSNNPTKVYPMNRNDSFSPNDIPEITRTPTLLITTYSELVSTVSKQDLVIEELV